MAKQKTAIVGKSTRKLKVTFMRHKVIACAIALCVVGLLVWSALFIAATHQERVRLDSIQVAMQVARANVQSGLRASLTDIKEYDSCYHREQTETPAPSFLTNGALYCGLNLQGATYARPGDMGDSGLWHTTLYVNEVLLNGFDNVGLTPILIGRASSEPEGSQPVSFHDSFNLYGTFVRCDVLADSHYNEFNYPSIKHDLPDQVYFSLNCYQRASMSFYHFVPSSLD